MPAMPASGHAAARDAASSGRFAITATHGKWRQRSWHAMPGGSSLVVVLLTLARRRPAVALLHRTGWATSPFMFPPTVAGAQAFSTAFAYSMRCSFTSGDKKNSPAHGLNRAGGRRSAAATRCLG
eukprot:3096074-Prymnesium_polylepis.1